MNAFFNNRTFIKKEKESSKIDDTWSINLDSLPEGVFHIIYLTEKGSYFIDMAKAQSKGKINNLKSGRQLIVPSDCWQFREKEK